MTKQVVRQFTSSSIKGDLYKYQLELPKLPVPTLQDTTDKYLKSVEPYLSPIQLQSTKKKIESFLSNQGPKLQQKLVEFASTKDNWLAEWWDDYAYLSYREPVVPYVSYFFAHKDSLNNVGQNQLLKATLLAYHTLEFSKLIEQETLEPEIIKGNPYCMNAFRFMFNNCRVPHEGKDITKMYDPTHHQYFLVAYKNHFFKLDCQNLSKSSIYNNLQKIINSPIEKSTNPIGILTSLNRDEFTQCYNHMIKSPINQTSFETIFALKFILCLDEEIPVTVEEKSALFWHSDGQNRYFDKPLQFFVAKNGSSGFLGEHSRMDATPTVQLNNYVIDKINQTSEQDLLAEIESNSVIEQNSSVELLKFDIDVKINQEISNAIVKFDQLMSTYDVSIFQYHGYGKNLIKQFKVSPDAYVQMLMQLAYFKLTGKIRPTYESAATRKFKNGRTETGRSVSNESKKFVETWTNYNSTIEEKVQTFQAACKQHVKYLSEAADGKGVDRHLFALKQMIPEGEPLPEIFTDPIFNYSQTWFISSSQVPSENFLSWGWSQVIDEGLGLAYLVNKDWLNIHISAKKGQGLNSSHFKWYLTETANEMKDILSRGEKSKL